MFTNRNLLDESKHGEIMTGFERQKDDTLTFSFNSKDEKRSKVVIRIIYQQVKSLTRIPDIEKFINANSTNHIVFVFDDISDKLYQQLREQYVEVFKTFQLMLDIQSHDIVPKHIRLTESEKEEFLTNYNVKIKDMPRIYSGDPMAKYLNLQPRDIVKVIRYSETAGYVPTYLVCVKGEIKS
jgi:DNA-directed RNA polymerase subunit H (RpoH/RPB5)